MTTPRYAAHIPSDDVGESAISMRTALADAADDLVELRALVEKVTARKLAAEMDSTINMIVERIEAVMGSLDDAADDAWRAWLAS